jgi:hypothetical protein
MRLSLVSLVGVETHNGVVDLVTTLQMIKQVSFRSMSVVSLAIGAQANPAIEFHLEIWVSRVL